MEKRCVILWLRNDLRLHDHGALTLLADTAEVLLPVYCLNPCDFETSSLGFSRTGLLRARFLLECLDDMRTALRARGSDLYIVAESPETAIPKLVKRCNAQVVFTERQVLGEAVQVERRLAAALEPLRVPLRSYWVSTLIDPGELPFPMANLPDRFEPFREIVDAVCEWQVPLLSPEKLPKFPVDVETVEPSVPFQQVAPMAVTLDADVMAVHGGESVALAHLEDFALGRRVSSAALFGEMGHSDRARPDCFGPWLAYGALSPRQIYQYVKYSGLENWSRELAAGVITGLLYRDYCRLLAIQRGGRVVLASDKMSEQEQERFEQWRMGETGEVWVDQHLQALARTGYLSIAGQQAVARFLTDELHLNWHWGAAWFASQLLDNDPYINLVQWMCTIGLWRIDDRQSQQGSAEPV